MRTLDITLHACWCINILGTCWGISRERNSDLKIGTRCDSPLLTLSVDYYTWLGPYYNLDIKK